MDVRGEGAERGLIAHEAVDVDTEELAAAIRVGVVLKVVGGVVVVGRLEGVRRRGARVVSGGP
jgi:hypothetical protein